MLISTFHSVMLMALFDFDTLREGFQAKAPSPQTSTLEKRVSPAVPSSISTILILIILIVGRGWWRGRKKRRDSQELEVQAPLGDGIQLRPIIPDQIGEEIISIREAGVLRRHTADLSRRGDNRRHGPVEQLVSQYVHTTEIPGSSLQEVVSGIDAVDDGGEIPARAASTASFFTLSDHQGYPSGQPRGSPSAKLRHRPEQAVEGSELNIARSMQRRPETNNAGIRIPGRAISPSARSSRRRSASLPRESSSHRENSRPRSQSMLSRRRPINRDGLPSIVLTPDKRYTPYRGF